MPNGSIHEDGDQVRQINFKVKVDDREPLIVKGYHGSYENNVYISLWDLAAAVDETDKCFNIVYNRYEDTFFLEKGKKYLVEGDENFPFETENDHFVALSMDKTYMDGREVRFRYYRRPGTYDIFMKLVDIGLYFDIKIDYGDIEELIINTKENFVIDMDLIKENGYFDYIHSAFLANLTTDEVLFERNADVQTQLASTSKLMTLLLALEAIKEGKIKYKDEFAVTQEVVDCATNEDGIFGEYMGLGVKMTVEDILYAFMLNSANECGTFIAQIISGSEEAFVKRMNERAKELGFENARFFNPHGLPMFDRHQITSKQQNMMSARELYKLSKYLLDNYYKEVTKITSTKTKKLLSLSAFAENTNQLLYNYNNCIGLKTGTTFRAGTALVAALKVRIKGKENILLSIMLGGENAMERYEKSTVLLEYAKMYYGLR
ncbi:MAG: serine hydrolase [Clostridia bacterium]|nr:serine hydrolase [Clostridia bacterium]